MPIAANTNWYNAHNFYGELDDLDAATLEDAETFFRTFYAPNNAALVIVGDFEPTAAWGWVEEYFAAIPAVRQPAKPDISEPRQLEEKRVSKTYPNAPRPAVAVGWHVPPRFTPEWFAFGLIDQILAQGKDSWLYEELVRTRGLTGDVWASINMLGSMFDYAGPMVYTVSVYHDAANPTDTLLEAMDARIAALRSRPVDRATLDRARTKLRSSLYSEVEQFNGFGRANLLASFALFDNDPGRINRLEADFAKVTPELIQRTAQEYLRPTNRTIVTVVAGGGAGATPGAN
jgi:predicted Zn-dependent peptidase